MATPDLLSSPERVEAILKRSGLDPETVDGLLVRASAAFRGATGQHISRRVEDEVRLDGNGSRVLLLPQVPVVAVHSVTVDGDALGADDYEWSESGMLRRAGRWPARYRSVTVVYDHGFNEVPEDVAQAVAEHAAVAMTRSVGVTNMQLGATSVGFDKGGVTEAWSQTVARYKVRR